MIPNSIHKLKCFHLDVYISLVDLYAEFYIRFVISMKLEMNFNLENAIISRSI